MIEFSSFAMEPFAIEPYARHKYSCTRLCRYQTANYLLLCSMKMISIISYVVPVAMVACPGRAQDILSSHG